MAQPAPAGDEAVVRRALGGDAEAAQVLFERWQPRLRARVRRRLPAVLRGKVAESDVIQEAFLTAFLRLADFEDRGAGSFGRWLGQILQNKLQDEVRRFVGTDKRNANREAAVAGSGVQGVGVAREPSPSTAAVAAESREAVRRAVRKLDRGDQEALRLVQEQRLTFLEVGERLHCSEEAARKRYTRALERLRKVVTAPGSRAPDRPGGQFPVAGDRLGPFRLGCPLGTGGMGTVFEAKSERPLPGVPGRSPVAVKVLRPELAARADFEARFRREAALGLKVRHPRVVRTIRVGRARLRGETFTFLATERVAGRSLRHVIAHDGPARPEFVRTVALDVAEALAALHDAGVVHRDLKPDNILIDGEGRAKVADLGLARLLADATPLTQSGAFVGSVHYAAPEQFRPRSGRADPRTDLYVLGMTLYELATGKHPFPSSNPWVAAKQQQTARPPRIRRERPDFDSRLDDVVAALLEPRPEDRIPSARALIQRLRGGEPPSATRPVPSGPQAAPA